MFKFETVGKLLLGTGVALALVMSLPVQAVAQQSTSGSMAVTSSVLSGCTVGALGLAFGQYDPANVTDTDAETTVAVSCTQGTPFDVLLNKGASAEASIADREMVGATASDILTYSVYLDAARTQVWGDTALPAIAQGSGSGVGTPVNFTAYGRIPALQNVPADSYADTITITVNF